MSPQRLNANSGRERLVSELVLAARTTFPERTSLISQLKLHDIIGDIEL
jgi:hypothetical protein